MTIPQGLVDPEEEFTPHETVELIVKMLEKNKDRILAFEVYMLMFHDPSSEVSLNEIPLTINRTNKEGTEEIREGEGANRQLKQSYMSVRLQVSNLAKYNYGFFNMIYNLYMVDEESIRKWPYMLAGKLYEQIPLKKSNRTRSDNTIKYLNKLVEKCIEKHFLYGRLLQWKKKYSDDGLLAALPFQNVEAMYMIEKELKKDYPREKEEPQVYYADVSRYFDYIGQELEKRDEYYGRLQVKTRYKEKFSSCPCLSVFQKEWEAGVNMMFEEIFKRAEESTDLTDKLDAEV